MLQLKNQKPRVKNTSGSQEYPVSTVPVSTASIFLHHIRTPAEDHHTHTQLISRPIAPFIAAVPRPGSALTSPRARTGTQSQTVGAEHARLYARCGEGGGLERRAGGEREIRIRVRPRRVGLVYGGWILRVESGVTDFACTLCTGALGMSATLRAAGI